LVDSKSSTQTEFKPVPSYDELTISGILEVSEEYQAYLLLPDSSGPGQVWVISGVKMSKTSISVSTVISLEQLSVTLTEIFHVPSSSKT
jgi:hypothetical protein